MINCYMDAAGKKYTGESPLNPSDSLLPFCSPKLIDVLGDATKPLTEAEIAAAFTEKETFNA